MELVAEADCSLVRMWGDIDAGLREEASAVMVGLLDRRLPVVVDASDVRFVDSSGLAFVLQLHSIAKDDGTGMVLRDPPAQLVELLEMIGMGGQIRQERTVGRCGAARPSVPDVRGLAAGDSVLPAAPDGCALTPAGG